MYIKARKRPWLAVACSQSVCPLFVQLSNKPSYRVCFYDCSGIDYHPKASLVTAVKSPQLLLMVGRIITAFQSYRFYRTE